MCNPGYHYADSESFLFLSYHATHSTGLGIGHLETVISENCLGTERACWGQKVIVKFVSSRGIVINAPKINH